MGYVFKRSCFHLKHFFSLSSNSLSLLYCSIPEVRGYARLGPKQNYTLEVCNIFSVNDCGTFSEHFLLCNKSPTCIYQASWCYQGIQNQTCKMLCAHPQLKKIKINILYLQFGHSCNCTFPMRDNKSYISTKDRNKNNNVTSDMCQT